MSIVVVTAPTVEPLSVGEAKDHLRVTDAADDSYIESLIKSARMEAEIVMGRTLTTTTFDWFLDGFFWSTMTVPRPSWVMCPGP